MVQNVVKQLGMLKNSKKNKKFHEKIPFRFEIFSESYIKHHSMRK